MRIVRCLASSTRQTTHSITLPSTVLLLTRPPPYITLSSPAPTHSADRPAGPHPPPTSCSRGDCRLTDHKFLDICFRRGPSLSRRLGARRRPAPPARRHWRAARGPAPRTAFDVPTRAASPACHSHAFLSADMVSTHSQYITDFTPASSVSCFSIRCLFPKSQKPKSSRHTLTKCDVRLDALRPRWPCCLLKSFR